MRYTKRLALFALIVFGVALIAVSAGQKAAPAAKTAPKKIENTDPALRWKGTEQHQAMKNATPYKDLKWRFIGPDIIGGRCVDVEVPKGSRTTFYVASAVGGLWKTENTGVTWECLTDELPTLSSGDIAISEANPDVIYYGTGEANIFRSSMAGIGVFKSVDAGKTWQHVGLTGTYTIGRIRVHPTNPDIAYVAASGHEWTYSPDRGVYKTADGGKTWEKVLYINEKIGAVDIVMVKSDPDTLYAAMYDKVRLPWHYELGGPESGLYKTTDGGNRWTKLGGGLPTGRIGRIGVDVLLKNPNTLYAVVENGNRRPPTPQEIDAAKKRGVEPSPQTMGNEVYRSDDAGKSWRKVNVGYEAALNKAPYSFNELKVDPNHADTVYITGQSLASTTDGGKTWKGLSWPSDGVMPMVVSSGRPPTQAAMLAPLPRWAITSRHPAHSPKTLRMYSYDNP